MQQYLYVKFDKPVDATKHCKSLGIMGCEIELQSGKTIGFDFFIHCSIDDKDKSILNITQQDPNLDSFPEIEELERNLNQIKAIKDCYIHPDIKTKPNISPVAILSWRINNVEIPEEILKAHIF